MYTANLSNLPPGVSQADCEQCGSITTEDVTVDEFIKSVRNGDGWHYGAWPEVVQAMYREWLIDDHSPLHEDDDSEELEYNFLESLTKAKVAA